MTDTGIIQSRTHDQKGDTVIIDGIIHRVPDFVEPFLARRKDGETVDYEFDVGMDGTTRTLRKIMPHRGNGSNPAAGKNTAKDPKLTTREGVLVSIDGTNLVTLHVGGREAHYGILPGLINDIKDKVNLPQKVAFSFDAVKIIQDLKLREHLENYTFVPASDLGTKKDKKIEAEPPLVNDEEMKVLKQKEQEIADIQKDPTLTDAEKKIISEKKAAEAKAAITRDPATEKKMQENGFTTAAEMMKTDPKQGEVLAELLKGGSITITIGGSTSHEQYETRKAEVTATIKSTDEYAAVFGLLYSALDECNNTMLKWKRGSF